MGPDRILVLVSVIAFRHFLCSVLFIFEMNSILTYIRIYIYIYIYTFNVALYSDLIL